MRYLNELQAWRYMAKLWEKASKDKQATVYVDNDYIMCMGICSTTTRLFGTNKISQKTFHIINNKLEDYGIKHNLPGFYWSNDIDGAKERAKFCQQKANRLLKYKREKDLRKKNKNSI